MKSAPAEVLEHMASARSGAASDYRRRLEEGQFLVLSHGPKGAASAWGWLTLPRERSVTVPWEWETALLVSTREGYLWDFFTVPDSRGLGLYQSLLRRVLTFCAQRGTHSVSIYCQSDNAASEAGILAAGFRRTALVTIGRAGPIYGLTGPSGFRVFRRGASVPLSDLARPSG